MVLQALGPSLFEICPNWPLCKPQWIRISTSGSRKAESSKATTEKSPEWNAGIKGGGKGVPSVRMVNCSVQGIPHLPRPISQTTN